jgi:hypothetical protein
MMIAITTMSMQERVAAGAARLDDRMPGWASRIDVANLRMAICAQCILGQLFGDFECGCSSLEIDPSFAAFGFGFDLRWIGEDVEENGKQQDSYRVWTSWQEAWNRLRDTWIVEIEARIRTRQDAVAELSEPVLA